MSEEEDNFKTIDKEPKINSNLINNQLINENEDIDENRNELNENDEFTIDENGIGANNRVPFDLLQDQNQKKELELILKDDKIINQLNDGNKINKEKEKTYKSTKEYYGTDCGCGGFRPEWLQRFRSPKSFLAVFSLLGILRTAYFTYTVACLSTIEKRYAMPAKTSAIILICDNVVSLFFNPVVGYFGTKINGPKLMGFGTLLVGISCFISSSPFFIYGTSDKLMSSSTFSNSLLNDSITDNSFKYEYCAKSDMNCENNKSSFNIGALMILACASILNGVGAITFWTIGLPYLDDNSKKDSSPIYISFSTVFRMFGVALGYLLSSFFLNFYENPFLDIDIKTNDPRFIGMWWSGYLFFGTLILLTSIPLFFFPASMGKPKKKAKGKKSFKDSMTMLNRLIRNPILVFDAIGGALKYIGFAGYWINKPRYIEAQFNVSASKSSFLTGATSTTVQVVGVLAGGFFLAKVKPRAKVLIRIIIAVEMICNILFLSATAVGCKSPSFGHISYENKQIFNLDCNQNCDCGFQTFQPVCSSDGVTNYFSPCFAGCKANYTNYDKLSKVYKFNSCDCDSKQTMTSGYCKSEECNNLPWYLIIMSSAGIISSFVRTPNIMILIRSVSKEDKAFAMGIVGSFMALFAFIPYPIIFGTIVDLACIVSEKTCGKKGNCWLYDREKLRLYLHLTPFCFFMIGSIFDFLIYLYADRLNLYEENDDDFDEHEMKINENKLDNIMIKKSSLEIQNIGKISEC